MRWFSTQELDVSLGRKRAIGKEKSRESRVLRGRAGQGVQMDLQILKA